jgi:hypothetical protein
VSEGKEEVVLTPE